MTHPAHLLSEWLQGSLRCNDNDKWLELFPSPPPDLSSWICGGGTGKPKPGDDDASSVDYVAWDTNGKHRISVGPRSGLMSRDQRQIVETMDLEYKRGYSCCAPSSSKGEAIERVLTMPDEEEIFRKTHLSTIVEVENEHDDSSLWHRKSMLSVEEDHDDDGRSDMRCISARESLEVDLPRDTPSSAAKLSSDADTASTYALSPLSTSTSANPNDNSLDWDVERATIQWDLDDDDDDDDAWNVDRAASHWNLNSQRPRTSYRCEI